MRKVISKGYTIEVVSWENDGDNYSTKSLIVDSLEEATAIVKLCESVFVSTNNGGGIGNISDGENKYASKIIIPFMRKYPELYSGIENPTDEELVDICMSINYNIMGSSEWYYSRVCESVIVYYSDKDIFLEEIIIK